MSEDEEKVKRYDQLMTDHKGLIIKVCQTYCRGDIEKSRDLFQDIALEIWTHMDTFKEKSKEATWLWHLAVNTAIDKLRASQRRPILALGVPLPERATEASPRRIDDLYEAIAHLSADDQMLVTARLEDYSYQEIAKQTGQNEGTLRVRYNRIVKQLRQLMNGSTVESRVQNQNFALCRDTEPSRRKGK